MFDKTIDEWLDEYAVSHQNKVNKLIHWLCVPAIMWTVMALTWNVGFSQNEYLNLSILIALCSLYFYFKLSWTLMIGMVLVTGVFIYSIQLFEATYSIAIWKVAIAVFVIAWIFQFIGHHIECKKPSFLKDVQFLLIGPIWLLSFIYKQLNIVYSKK